MQCFRVVPRRRLQSLCCTRHARSVSNSSKSWLRYGAEYLSEHGECPNSAGRDSLLLVEVVANARPPGNNISNNGDGENGVEQKNAFEHFQRLLERRAKGEPVAYIRGYANFWKDRFMVNSDTLIPRPETEQAIEYCLEHLPDHEDRYTFLDLGTGSGAILLSLLREFPNASGFATDISEEALKVASTNSVHLGLDSRASMMKANWSDHDSVRATTFDVIVCNPPYIAVGDPQVDKLVHRFEPHTALYASDGGLDSYRQISQQNIHSIMNDGSILLLELGLQADCEPSQNFDDENCHVHEICAMFVPLKKVEVLKDLAGIQRYLVLGK